MANNHSNETRQLDEILKALNNVTSRLDSMQTRIEKQEKTLSLINESGLLNNLMNLTKASNVADACGLDSEKMYGRKTTSIESKRKQAVGANIFSAYCAIFAVLMFLAFEGRLPLTEWEKSHMFKNIDEVVPSLTFMKDTMHWPVLMSIAYVVTIFGIQALMKNRKPFDLRTPLALWSLSIGLFSLVGALRTVPVAVNMLLRKGITESICGYTAPDWVMGDVAGFWTYLFVLSKVPELIDTLFIVLRKRTLITLHWYHHITVMWFCWNSWATCCLNGIFYAAMNLTVHAFMYFFYFLAALDRRPTAYAEYITIIQILQMVVGTAITFFVNYHMQFVAYKPYTLQLSFSYELYKPEEHDSCFVHPTNALAGLIMYSSYLWLFCVFYYQAYILKQKAE